MGIATKSCVNSYQTFWRATAVFRTVGSTVLVPGRSGVRNTRLENHECQDSPASSGAQARKGVQPGVACARTRLVAAGRFQVGARPLRRLVYEQLANISCGNGTMCGVRFLPFQFPVYGRFFCRALFVHGRALSVCPHRPRAGFCKKEGVQKARFIEIMPVFEGSLLIGQAGAR